MGKEITEINKDTFWQFIEEAKGQCGKDMDAMVSWLERRMLGMQPEQVLKFHTVLYGTSGRGLQIWALDRSLAFE